MAKIILNKGNSKDRFGHKDLEANLKAGVKYSEILEYLKKNPDKLWSGNKKGKPGGLYDLVSSKTQEENKEKGEKAQKDQLKIDNETVKGGYTRVDPGEYKEGIAFDKDGIAIKTYDGKTLKIGNLPSHRYDDSPYADIEIIDYDASVEGYNPAESLKKLGIIKDNVYDSKGKIKGVTLKDPKVKRQDYTADTFRGDKQKEDYSERGLTEKGGQIAGYKGERYAKEGKYDKVRTDKNGNLKRLTLTEGGQFKPTDDDYPTEVKSNSFSDQLEVATGLKSEPVTRQARMASIKSRLANQSRLNKDTYIKSGKTQLSIK